jgi:fluoride exporter
MHSKSLLIFLGAGSGGVLRYWVSSWVHNQWGSLFPLGTLAVNLSGCLIIGFLAAAFNGPFLIRDEYRAALIVGILGGYTTFSSFGRETMVLVEESELGLAALNIVLSVGLGLLGVWAGGVCALKLFGSGAS